MLTHVPVLFSDILQLLQLQPNDNVIDATLGGGGHARGLLEATAPNGRLLGIEADLRTLEETKASLTEYGSRFIPVHGNFRHLTQHVQANNLTAVQGILLDLGVSSMTLGDASRGFSFQTDGPLDMRFDAASQTQTAADIINLFASTELAKIFSDYGQEPLAGKIADHLVSARKIKPITTTLQLADAVSQVKHRRGRIHPATQVFQALRIAVNDELGALQEVLPQTLTLLASGKRLAVITFHSLEDRIVKQWSHDEAKAGRLRLINKHVIVAGRSEQLDNPRSRSAKLRIMEKI